MENLKLIIESKRYNIKFLLMSSKYRYSILSGELACVILLRARRSVQFFHLYF